MYKRNETLPIDVGGVLIGGNNDVVIQSMTNTKTHDIDGTLKQINELVKAGARLVRVAVFDDEDVLALKEIVSRSPCPIVADIHFNYMFAIKAIEAGVAKIRLNPGNISDENQLIQIIEAAKKHDTAIRIGVNSGSIPLDLVNEDGVSSKSMIIAAKRYVKFFEDHGFKKIILSLKCSDPLLTIETYRLSAKEFKYPLHIGVTESGSLMSGTIKSCAGLSPILLEGIGNTIRISLTCNPVHEITVCKKLLASLGIASNIVEIISCPTCGRLDFKLEKVVSEIENYTKDMNFPLKISILGCVVNGIGEGKESDIGIAGSAKKGMIFEKGKIIKTVPENELVPELKKLIDKYKEEWEQKNIISKNK